MGSSVGIGSRRWNEDTEAVETTAWLIIGSALASLSLGLTDRLRRSQNWRSKTLHGPHRASTVHCATYKTIPYKRRLVTYAKKDDITNNQVT